MTQPHMKAVARFVRDLLDYDEQLIKFDRRNVQASDFSTSYIVVNGSLPQSVLARGQRFNGEAEVMTYSASVSHAIVLEFYGDEAYSNAENFLMLSYSQAANELRRTHSLTIMAVSNIIDVGQLLGQSHGNRVHLSFNVQYAPARDVQTLRIDTPQFQFLEDK
ncbi:phage neck terminator protein [Citrobacter europaeus]|uniref:phage neck terminator protein n=1 Tax=Citrobacter europaeus TaxID=1914243 RepID=UPI0033488AD9